MRPGSASFFAGIPAERLEAVLAPLVRRRFEAGSLIVATGDRLRELWAVMSGEAEVFVNVSAGAEHRLRVIGPGDTIGEMSFFSGDPASASVRALADLEVVAIDADHFERLARELPQLYRNLGAVFAVRLAHATRLLTGEPGGTVTILRDASAPPLLADALGASIVWHTRRPTLLLSIDADHAPSNGVPGDEAGPHCHRANVRPEGPFAPDALRRTLDQLVGRYAHVLVLTASPSRLGIGPHSRQLALGAPGTLPASGEDYAVAGGRPGRRASDSDLIGW